MKIEKRIAFYDAKVMLCRSNAEEAYACSSALNNYAAKQIRLLKSYPEHADYIHDEIYVAKSDAQEYREIADRWKAKANKAARLLQKLLTSPRSCDHMRVI